MSALTPTLAPGAEPPKKKAKKAAAPKKINYENKFKALAATALKRHLKAGFPPETCITAEQIMQRIVDQGTFACAASQVPFCWENPLKRPVLCRIVGAEKSYVPYNVLLTTRAFCSAKGNHPLVDVMAALYDE